MRIKEDYVSDSNLYSNELQDRVLKVFRYASELSKLNALIEGIKEQAVNLRELFLSEKEREEQREELNKFDAKVQLAVYYTLKNLEAYQQFEWQKLKNEGDYSDDSADSVK